MRKYLLPVFFVLFVSCASAQHGLTLGLSGTFSSTWILKQDNYGTLAPFENPIVRESRMAYKYTWGGNFGFVAGYNFTNNWGIQAEFQINWTGQNYDDNFEGPATIEQGTFGVGGTPVNVTRQVRLNYIQVPVMVRYISNGRLIRGFGCLGPQFGFRTNAQAIVTIAGYYYAPDSLSPDQRFRSFDFGVAVQGGVEIVVTKNLYFDAGLSSYIGVLDINGAYLRELGAYGTDETKYRASNNFRAGVMAGVHLLIPTHNWKHYY